MSASKISEFIGSMRESLADGTFVRLSLGNYEGDEADLKKLSARMVTIKRVDKISFTYSYQTRDIVKNDTIGDAFSRIENALLGGFESATLFTTTFNLTYPAMKRQKPTEKDIPSKEHDTPKKRQLAPAGKTYLQDLNITDSTGAVFKNAQDKFRQIDKYVEILGGLINPDKAYNIVDMGAGKGYLTFALYDYLQQKGIAAQVTGVELRKELVDLCNAIAKKSGFDRLKFVKGSVEEFDAAGMNMLIALHACDTATDDAIAKGIRAGAEVIIAAPCCHKQVRREIEAGKKKNDLDFLMKYGTLLERQAEMVTDAMRALLLEHAGYAVKLFEFVSDAHTPKNVMIVATRTGRKNPGALEKFTAAKQYFGISEHHLEKALRMPMEIQAPGEVG